MPGKWQLLIFLGQQQIKQLQQKNCSLVYRRRYNNQSIAFVHPQGWRHYPKSKISVSFEVHLSLFLWLCFFITYLTLPCQSEMEVPCCYRQKGIVVPWSGEISISCVPPAFPVAGSDIFCCVVTSALESCLRKLLK